MCGCNKSTKINADLYSYRTGKTVGGQLPPEGLIRVKALRDLNNPYGVVTGIAYPNMKAGEYWWVTQEDAEYSPEWWEPVEAVGV